MSDSEVVASMIRNHPGDELLSSYSAGSLPLGQALCVSIHSEFCTNCRKKLKRFSQVGGELMLRLNRATVSLDLKNTILNKIDEDSDSLERDHQDMSYSGKNKVSNVRSGAGESSVPRGLRQFVKSDYQEMPWRRVAKSIHNIELFKDDENTKVEILKIKSGGSVTTHFHLGDEYTVILEGSFSDEDGLYQQGDFLVRNSWDEHTPVATQDRDCICLAVSEAPLQFAGFFKRLLNPLIRLSYSQN
ncbi:MAG: ChrR family anti-sigma-E factor [Arenicellaceae bacterium]|nr:ChrR family anti-sigma-E factor [Arenicellaceae bacterium]